MTLTEFGPMTSPSGHSRSYEVKCVFLLLTFDRIEIDQWDLTQCVSLAKPHQLICNMTHRGHHVTLCDLELRSNFELDC